MKKSILAAVSVVTIFIGLVFAGCSGGGIASDKFEGTWVGEGSVSGFPDKPLLYEYKITKNGDSYMCSYITVKPDRDWDPREKSKDFLVPDKLIRVVREEHNKFVATKLDDNTIQVDLGLGKLSFTYMEKDRTLLMTPKAPWDPDALHRAGSEKELDKIHNEQIEKWKEKYGVSPNFEGLVDKTSQTK